MMRRRLEAGVGVALAATVTTCTSKPTGPACEEARYEGRVVDAIDFDYGPIALEVDDRGRTSGRIDGVQDWDGHFLGEVIWADLEVDCQTGHFDTVNAIAADCDSEDVMIRANFSTEGSWLGVLQLTCWTAGKGDDGTALILAFEAFPVD